MLLIMGAGATTTTSLVGHAPNATYAPFHFTEGWVAAVAAVGAVIATVASVRAIYVQSRLVAFDTLTRLEERWSNSDDLVAYRLATARTWLAHEDSQRARDRFAIETTDVLNFLDAFASTMTFGRWSRASRRAAAAWMSTYVHLYWYAYADYAKERRKDEPGVWRELEKLNTQFHRLDRKGLRWLSQDWKLAGKPYDHVAVRECMTGELALDREQPLPRVKEPVLLRAIRWIVLRALAWAVHHLEQIGKQA